MDALIKELKSLHKDMKSDRPKADKLNGNAAYRNGFEDGYKLVTRRIRSHFESLEQSAKSDKN